MWRKINCEVIKFSCDSLGIYAQIHKFKQQMDLDFINIEIQINTSFFIWFFG